MEFYYGTNGADDVLSPVGRSTYYLQGGNDTITGVSEPRGKWGDLKGRPDVDIVYLGAGDDLATGFNSYDTIYAGRGDDVVTVSTYWPAMSLRPYTTKRSKAYGEEGHDELSGAWLLDGGAGNDTLTSYGGRVDGGPGHDVYRITGAVERIIDREGRSVIDIDFSADDYLIDRDPVELIVTGDRKDVITLKGTAPTVRSGGGADIVKGGGTVYGGAGNDTLGGRKVYGATGQDVISAGWADGGQGNDQITASEAYGGRGNDTISCITGEGGEGNDSISGDFVDGGDGNDTVEADREGHGGSGDDLMSGRNLYGEDGDDTLDASGTGHGGAGDDEITGGGRLIGANGDDTLSGNHRTDDLLFGGRGADVLNFALYEGNDLLRGDAGADTYVLTAFEPDDLPMFIATADSIEGFEHGVDRIDLRARDGIAGFDDIVIEQVGDFVTLKDEAGYLLVVVVDDVTANFTADDFVF